MNELTNGDQLVRIIISATSQQGDEGEDVIYFKLGHIVMLFLYIIYIVPTWPVWEKLEE